jgi:acetyl-CoA C-acetyltransferase
MQSPAMQPDVMVVSGGRTVSGECGGALQDLAPTAQGAQVVREARAAATLCRAGSDRIGNARERDPVSMTADLPARLVIAAPREVEAS